MAFGDPSKPFSFGALVLLWVRRGRRPVDLTHPLQVERQTLLVLQTELRAGAVNPSGGPLQGWGGLGPVPGRGACSNGGSLAQRSHEPHLGLCRSAPEVGRLDPGWAPPPLLKGLLGTSQPLFQMQGSGSLDGGAGFRRGPWARPVPSPGLHADEGWAVPPEARVSALPSSGRPPAETEAGPSSSLCPRSGPQTPAPVHGGHEQVLRQVPRASPAAPAPGGPHAEPQHAPGPLCECPAPLGGT